jgi:ubiquinone biosynthesis O-methyltransferase
MRNHQQKIQAEAEYWNKEADNEYCVPDIRDLETKRDISYIWDDPVIEDIVRGEYRRFIISKAMEKKDGNVLEIGCGTGWLSLELARAGMNVKGVDLSEKRIAIAQRYFEQLKKKENIKGDIDYIACPVQEVSFKKSVFDLIVCWDSLHHIQNIESIMKKITQWLKPDGQLIIFEYIGLPFLNKIIIMIIYALPVINKAGILKKIESKITNDNSARKAPLEGITGLEMLRAVKRYLELKIFKTTLSISYYVAPYICGNRSLKHKFVRFLKRLDDAITNLHFLRGQYIFLWATKKRKIKDR